MARNILHAMDSAEGLLKTISAACARWFTIDMSLTFSEYQV